MISPNCIRHNDLSCKEEIDLETLLHFFHATCVIPLDSISIVVEELSESF